MEFCRIPRTFDDVSALLKDAASAKSRNPYTDLPLYPSAYLGHLEGAGGLLWDEGWILTEDGAAFLEAHRVLLAPMWKRIEPREGSE